MKKNIDRPKLQWLLDELAELREQGVVDEAAAQRIREYYAAADEQTSQPAQSAETAARAKRGKQQYLLYSLVVLGAMLVGSGVILLFAHNWDMLALYQRIAVASIPVIIGASCGVCTVVWEKDGRWREFSAFFTAVGFAVLTALISQIYNLSGTIPDFMRLVLAVSLPLVYIFHSHLLNTAYCIAAFAFLGDYYDNYGVLYYLAAAPFILYYLFFRKRYDGQTVWMRYICLVPVAYFLLYYTEHSGMRMELFTTAALLYTAGLFYDETGVRGWKNPWMICGWFMLTVLFVLASSSIGFLLNDAHYHNFSDETSVFILMGWRWLIPFLAGAYVIARKPTPFKVMVMLTSLLPVLWYFMRDAAEAALWINNGLFLLIGAASIAEGAKGHGIIRINAGMLQIALLAGIRFYDSRMDILTRALAFIVIGAAFIAINVYMGRKFKNEKKLSAAQGGGNGDVEE